MPDPFPHYCSAALSRAYPSRSRREGTLPPVFPNGSSTEFASSSPENMLLSSLGFCMLTTFEAFAERDGIEILAWDAKIGGTIDQTFEGPMFTSIVLELDVLLAGNVDCVEDTLEDARQHCLVLNSLRVPVVIEAQLRTPNEMPDDRSPELRGVPSRGTFDQHHAS